MGICIWSQKSTISVSGKHREDALLAIKNLQKESEEYLRPSPQSIANAETIEDALYAWGFSVSTQKDGTVSRWEFVGDKGDFSPLMHAIAPYVEPGGIIEMGVESEPTIITEFNFDNGNVSTSDFYHLDDDYMVPVEDFGSGSLENTSWYSEHIHFKYEGELYRIVSWKEVDDVLSKAKKQVARGLKYGKDNASFLDWDYEYNQGVLAEKIHKEMRTEADELQAVITMNRYDSLCLNTPKVAFIDLDVPSETYQKFSSAMAKRKSYKQRITKSIERYFADNPEESGVLYETAEGMRLVFTHRLLTVHEAEQKGYFKLEYCDYRYAKMCIIQECFRARLTPKPWREKTAKQATSVCRIKHEFNAENHCHEKELDDVLALHDSYCLNDEALELV